MTVLFVAIAVLVLLLVLAERRGPLLARVVTKLLASTGFLAVAWFSGAFATTYGRVLFAGLVLAWIGDACLLSSERGPFLAGLVAFLAGHVAYGIAFALTGPAASWMMISGLGVALLALGVWRWLSPHVEGPMRGPVVAYVVAISGMVVLAWGAYGAGDRKGAWAVPAGAVAFFLSDLAVARDRFVAPGWSNRVWGLPMYYLGQVLLATSVA